MSQVDEQATGTFPWTCEVGLFKHRPGNKSSNFHSKITGCKSCGDICVCMQVCVHTLVHQVAQLQSQPQGYGPHTAPGFGEYNGKRPTWCGKPSPREVCSPSSAPACQVCALWSVSVGRPRSQLWELRGTTTLEKQKCSSVSCAL